MTVLSTAVQVAAPWASAYSDTKWLQTAITFVHVSGVVVGGGCAIAADRATIAAARAASWTRRRRQLAVLRRTHAPVLGGLALTFASGLLMLAADLENLASSWAFWTKMAVVALLLANGGLLMRSERRLRADTDDARAWGRLRVAAACSLALWLAAVLGGTALVNAS
jgi:hypothetical protein